jgi:hypothetical protein
MLCQPVYTKHLCGFGDEIRCLTEGMASLLGVPLCVSCEEHTILIENCTNCVSLVPFLNSAIFKRMWQETTHSSP